MKQNSLMKNAVMYVAVGLLYFILALPFSSLTFPDGYTELRFTGLLPMAAGLLFGFPGALACALGNLGGDLYSGWNIFYLFGFLGNFLMAWLPYKLWHTLFTEHSHLLHYLDSPGSVLKFVAVTFISSCGSVGVIAAGGQLLHGFSFGTFFVSVALQYYDFSILGGMLLFHICVSVLHIVPCIPKGIYGYPCKKGAYMPDYLISVFIVVLSIIIAVFTLRPEGAEILAEGAIRVLCLILLISSAILALLPMQRDRAKKVEAAGQPQYAAVTGLRSQCIIVFMATLCGFLSFSSFTSFRLLYMDYLMYGQGGGDPSIIWIRVIFSVALAATVLVAVLFLILRLISSRAGTS